MKGFYAVIARCPFARYRKSDSKMIAYLFGAGASAHADYPLASNLLLELSNWLDDPNVQMQGVEKFRVLIAQLRDRFRSLEDFERILSILGSDSHNRVKLGSDAAQSETRSLDRRYQREDLVSAIREFFYHIEKRRVATRAYRDFGRCRASVGDTLITFNYDVALERALKTEGKWDIGTGYGFPLFPERPQSPLTVFKMHGSVNWFKEPIRNTPPPLMFSSDLELLGYNDIKDRRIGRSGCGVDNTQTLILPDTDKRFYWEQLWLPLWESAARRLRSVREVFIHGYSLPCADARARRLLFDNISPRALVHIFCRGDSERIAAEFRQRGFSDVRPNSEIRFEVWSSDSGLEGC